MNRSLKMPLTFSMRSAMKRISALCLLLMAFFAFAQSRGVAQQVVVLHLDDTIQPISEQYLERGLTQAAQSHADALLVDLNTPGGLLDTTRSMVSKILASPVPVIVFVAPSGSRAGSAGRRRAPRAPRARRRGWRSPARQARRAAPRRYRCESPGRAR